MRMIQMLRRSLGATVATALAVTSPATAFAGAGPQTQRARVAPLPPGTQRPTTEVQLSIGQGEMISLPAAVSEVWTSNPEVADVHISSARQIYLFGKAFGEATIYATTANGTVAYSSNVRVSQNITSLDRMLKQAMPEADIRVTTIGQIAVMNGVVASPEESAQAQQLVTALLNPGINPDAEEALKIGVINRLKTASPLQVNLQVRIAEVSRSFVKNIGVNLQTRDRTGGFQFGVSSGRSAGSIGSVDTSSLPQLDASSQFGFPAGTISLPFDPQRGTFVYPNTGTAFQFGNKPDGTRTALNLAGKLFGLDVLSAIDLGETIGQVTTLANPNLTALSGETATFLAGGEIPIPINQGLGAISVQYKQYGVSLAYTPTVLSDGRISLRVRPEVSQLSAAGAVVIGNTQVPALTTRRAETTVELGSGQSFMIAGLLSNDNDNQIEKAPGLGDLPILGALFRSNGFQRSETELVIVVTPYLVKPVNANDIVLPTDGYKSPTDIERVLLGKLSSGDTGGDRPKPVMAPAPGVNPAFGAAATPLPAGPSFPEQAPENAAALPAPATPRKPADKGKDDVVAAPGFSSN
ncbi:type II and III secretion system protein family protein [Sphingomonas japonica]|uniref:Pilus assembly protein CpaC n=1 Tax=Sphingomonas japonica TaxID=511662 RepID=A0ABX0U1Y4_9SPHN|nr:type II and III secretion system protein family protein [Sphingomonas japonica]NIJ22743.1 pilus assembly protein CpaC [Sphingomonas japonica]